MINLIIKEYFGLINYNNNMKQENLKIKLYIMILEKKILLIYQIVNLVI